MFLCQTCIYKCKLNKNSCQNYEPVVDKIELKDLVSDIRKLNPNLHKFCKKHGLKYKYFKRMIDGEMEMSYKALYLINNSLLNEKREWSEFLKRHPSGLNEDNDLVAGG